MVAEHWRPTALAAGVTASLLATGVLAGGAFLFHWGGIGAHPSRSARGCAPFGVYSQNVWVPYGARELSAPTPLAEKVAGFAPNEIITVDGWEHSVSPYPNNKSPFDSDIWYRAADHRGWVAFAAVRGLPTANDPSNSGDGGPPAAAPSGCELP